MQQDQVLGYQFDYSSEDGAHTAAKKIRRYWTDRGFSKIQTRVQLTKFMPGHSVYGVTSNIGLFGYPPR